MYISLFLTQIVTYNVFEYQVFAVLIIKKTQSMLLIILKAKGLLVTKFLSPYFPLQCKLPNLQHNLEPGIPMLTLEKRKDRAPDKPNDLSKVAPKSVGELGTALCVPVAV